MPESYPIIYFDGICGLCNKSVYWILKRDKQGIFRFAPVVSNLSDTLSLGDQTIELVYQGKKYVRSTAILKIVSLLPFPWRLFAVAYIIPRPLRDMVYRWVAMKRYAWFGKHQACPIPPPAWKARFIYSDSAK